MKLKWTFKLFFLYFSLNLVTLYAEDDKRYIASLTQGLTYNYFQTSVNRQLFDSTFSYISLDSVNDNLTSPWVWDSDTFIINHIGHPVQGSIYFTASRSNHLDFYESTLSTLIGSITWEYFLENERQSINDLIVTTTGGAVIGEMFYRLSDALWYDSDTALNKIIASVFSPISSLNRVIYDEESRNEKRETIHGYLKGNYNSFHAYAQYGSESVELEEYDLGFDEFNSSLNMEFEIEYGDKFNKNIKPFDYFEFKTTFGVINDGLTLSMFSEGLLKGEVLNLSDNSKQMIGIYLGLDYLYGDDTINLGANTLGLGYSHLRNIKEDLFFDIDLYLNLIFLGSSDYAELKYLETIVTYDEETRNYSIELGDNLKLYSKIEKIGFGSISFSALIYNMFIIPSSVEDEGSVGYDIIGIFDLSFEKEISYDWSIGLTLKNYSKFGFYDDSEDIKEILSGLSIYVLWNF